MFKYNFHTHTSYCDGSSEPEKYVEAAVGYGLKSLGFSGHAPVSLENSFAIQDMDSLASYCNDILKLKNKYKDQINIYLALEADFIPGITFDFADFRQDHGLDYIIGSVHLVKAKNEKMWFIDGADRNRWINGLTIDFEGDIKEAVKAYYSQISLMAESQKPDVIGHLDKVKMHNREEFFSVDDPWHLKLVRESLEVIREMDAIVEINTRGLYKKRTNSLFPGLQIIKLMKELNIPVTISADAHKPVEVGMLLDEAAQALISAGYKEVYIFSDGQWRPIPLG
ncbi:MAG: histidinol-phosphatase [Bacteroidota bacterium]